MKMMKMMGVFILSAILVQLVLAGPVSVYIPYAPDCALHYLKVSNYSGDIYKSEVKGMWRESFSYVKITRMYYFGNFTEIRRFDLGRGDKCPIYKQSSCEEEDKQVDCSTIGKGFSELPDTDSFTYDTYTTPYLCPNGTDGCTKYIRGETYVIADGYRHILEHHSSSATYTYTYFDNDPPSLSDFASTKCELAAPTVDICSLSYSSLPWSEISKQDSDSDSSETPAYKVYDPKLGCSFHMKTDGIDVKGLKTDNNAPYMLSITLSSGERQIERGDKTDSFGNCLNAFYDDNDICLDSGYEKCTDFTTFFLAFVYKTEDIVKCPDGKSSDCKMYCNDGQCVIADAKGRCVSDGYTNYTYIDNDLPSLKDFEVTKCDGTVIPAPTESHCSDATDTDTSGASDGDSTVRGPISDAAVTAICIGTGVVVLAVIIVMLIVRQIQMKKLDHI